MIDVDPMKVVALEPTVATPRARLRAGDVVAIPSGAGPQFHAVVLIPRCTFGTALGLLLDRGAMAALAQQVEVPGVLRRPVFTDDRSIGEGSWQIVGHDDALLSVFPLAPEIYHRPDPVLESLGFQLGPFGAAENLSGTLRLLDEAEAQEIGLLGVDFRQTHDSQQLQRMLGDLARARGR